MQVENLIGKVMVGYRYGEAPESGYSRNYQTNTCEPGVSMAQVGFMCEYNSFAISEAAENRRKVYYIGEVAGFGGDDEICLTNIKRISYKEYISLRKEYKENSNEYVKAIIADKTRLADLGYCGYNEDEIKAKYNKYIK